MDFDLSAITGMFEDVNWPVFAVLYGTCLIGMWMKAFRNYWGIPMTAVLSVIMIPITLVILKARSR